MFKKLTPTLLVASILVGCAKEKSYDKVYKEPEQLRKSAFKLTETINQKVVGLDGVEKTVTKEIPVKYLYVPMTMGTPMEVVDAAPFYQGKEKIVKLAWSEEGLEVIELPIDDRFSDNELNELPVLTLPGTYASYQCSEDEYGDCTNKEEENTEITWEEKTHFTPDYAGMQIKEVNFLNAANAVEAGGCASLQGTKVVDYEISDGVVNVELEKTYKLNNTWRCIRRNFDFTNYEVKNSSFNVRYFFSLVELKQLATPGYKAISYPTPDHDEFGFFKAQRLVLNDNFDSQREDKEILMNRWAPQRKNNELVYHLSSNYSKPENKALLNATYEVAAIINQGFDEAKVPFNLKLVTQEHGKPEVAPGDLRYNTIVLIEDPLANGLLGYGPSVANPYTGEIVQAHTNMYGGVLTSTVRRVYQAAVDLSIERNKEEPVLLEGYTVAKSALESLPETLANELATAKEESEEGQTPVTPEAASVLAEIGAIDKLENIRIDEKMVQFPEASIEQRLKHFAHFDEKQIQKVLDIRMAEQVDLRQKAMTGDEGLAGFSALDRKMIEMSEGKHGHGFFDEHTIEEFPIAGTTKVIYPAIFNIPGIKNPNGTLKPFDKLSKQQKEKVKTIILVESYKSTLIHELGHNLGLRHNFSGSTDAANFFTEDDAVKFGMEKPAAYSSIMDYAFSDYNELKSLGKYDMAALKFAYARKVDLVNGQEVKVVGSITDLDESLEVAGLARKPFAFCTDENAGLSSLCNRFDEGTTLTEIAKFRIKRYGDLYKYRNFRDGRLDYSAYDVHAYSYWRRYEFGQIRDIIEEFEFFAGIFGIDTMSRGCSPAEVAQYPICKRINDYRDAVSLVGDFFIDILKTPDHICAVANKDKPNVIVKYTKLSDIYDDVKYDIKHVPTSCFDGAVTAQIEKDSKGKQLVVGENGKFLNGFKDTNPEYKYVTDRAVLGTWPDKVFAMEALFKRRWRHRTTDSNQMALIDIPSIQEKALNILTHYAAGVALEQPLPFTTKNGGKFLVPYVIGSDYKIEQLEDVFGGLKRVLGMDKSGQNNLIKVALNRIEKQSVNVGEANSKVAHESANIVAVNKFSAFETFNQIPNHTYWFDGIDLIYHSSDQMPIANVMVSSIVEKSYLDTVDKAQLLDVIKRRTNPDAPAELSDNHKVFFGLPESLHTQLVELGTQGAEVPVEAFNQALGPVNGPKVFAVYNEGVEVMKSIIAMRQAIMTQPSNPSEAKLFNLPIDLLVQYISGKMTDDLVDFYKKQLKNLPKYKTQEDLREGIQLDDLFDLDSLGGL